MGMLSDRTRDLLRWCVHEVEVYESGETPAQITMQCAFGRAPQLTRRDQHQLIEGSTSVSTQEQVRESPSVLGETLFGGAATGRS